MRVVLCVFLVLFSLEANMYHQKIIKTQWQEQEVIPFDEMFLSWSAKRPTNGKYLFQVSVKVSDVWSAWIPYAQWGSDGQAGSSRKLKKFPAKVHQDALIVLNENMATGFQVKVICEGTASLDDIYGLHVYTNGKGNKVSSEGSMKVPISLEVKGLSQMVLDHPRHKSLCSPTSTTAVVRYLLESTSICPIAFAQNVWDSRFDIYGNWVFNTAHAASLLGPKWSCWVERLSGFSEIYHQLEKGFPVIVSIRGPLEGSGTSGKTGHLIAVIGYDPVKNRVLCRDPGLESDDQTQTSFPLSEFLEAWGKRGNIAYIFNKN